MVVNRSLLFELELDKYLDITTSKAQIISPFVTSCLLVHTLIVICFEDNASLEFPASVLNKVKAFHESSIRLKNKIGVSFGNFSLCFPHKKISEILLLHSGIVVLSNKQ